MVKPMSLDKTESISNKTESAPEAASGEYDLGSFSFPYENQNEFLSKLLFFGPLVEELGKITRDIAMDAAFLIGAFWTSRIARKYVNKIKAETSQLENAAANLPDDIGRFYWPEDPKANEAAENEAKRIVMAAERAKQGAASAAGIF
ncbi:MAG: hypothetical protein HYU98_03040 [Deltaproteobacteria bacterium]|nr:hypothetical protein [Deltaproteobacteria bacterium]